jgi:hypothetical protein
VPNVGVLTPHQRHETAHIFAAGIRRDCPNVSLNSELFCADPPVVFHRSADRRIGMSQDAIRTASPNGIDVKFQRDSLSSQVQGLIDEARSNATSEERRNRDRFPIPFTFKLTPLDQDGKLLIDETTTVVGKDLSLTGIGFSHDHALPYRRAIVTLDHPRIGKFAVEAEFVWTRPTPIGLFESGCRLIRTVDGHTVRSKS